MKKRKRCVERGKGRTDLITHMFADAFEAFASEGGMVMWGVFGEDFAAKAGSAVETDVPDGDDFGEVGEQARFVYEILLVWQEEAVGG